MTSTTTATTSIQPVHYITRTQDYYTAQGFEHVYQYAYHDEAPFAPMPKSLSECTVGLVTTASIYERAPLEPRKVDSGSTSAPPERLYTNDLYWDKDATHTDDINSFCPIATLAELAAAGRIGALAPRFHCAATEYSQKTTLMQDAPDILRRLQEDGADIALLVPL